MKHRRTLKHRYKGKLVKKILFAMTIGLSALFASTGLAWLVFPEKTATLLLKLNNASAGLSAKIVRTELGAVHYLEGGQGETIVLVHGIYARKEHWVDLARHLTEDYHVIALDLPGFGDNETLSDGQYLIGQQQKNFLTVLDALEVETAHVAANSMGAYVAAMLAHDNPDRISSLAFIGSPLGVPTRTKSDMDLALENGIKPLLARSETDFHARMAWLSPNPPYVPGPILNAWMKSEVAATKKNERIWDVVHTQSTAPSVLELAPRLTMETLIVWCSPDRIFHVSGADELAKRLAKATLTIMEGCGHVPMLDKPDEVAGAYLNFLRSMSSTNSN
jgi:pimeloyl-ACP methyl ester carboxylesterase